MHDKYEIASISRIELNIRRIINGLISFILLCRGNYKTNISRITHDKLVGKAWMFICSFKCDKNLLVGHFYVLYLGQINNNVEWVGIRHQASGFGFKTKRL